MRKEICLILAAHLFISPLQAKEKLVFAVDLIRHGDRTPMHQIPKSPHAWAGLGELTPKGMQQEYELGKNLRAKYITQLHFLPEHYDGTTMLVRSTDFNRTLMSAESLLLGLYPLGTGPDLENGTAALPYHFQPIPIHTVVAKKDYLLKQKAGTNPWQVSMMKNKMKRAWDEKTKALSSQLAKWRTATGLELCDAYELMQLADNLLIRKQSFIAEPQGLDKEDVDAIIQLSLWAKKKTKHSKELNYPLGHLFLTTIGHDFQTAIKQQNPLKFILFSAHDGTIRAVMNTLGVRLDETPPYASDLNFSLLQEKNDYFVTINYNQKPVVLKLCGKQSCTLKQFMKVIHA